MPTTVFVGRDGEVVYRKLGGYANAAQLEADIRRYALRRRRMVDDGAGVSVLAALAAGVVSFLSPCVLPLVPGYLSAVSGVKPNEIEDASLRRVLVPALLFVASFSAIFIVLGLGATKLGSSLNDHRETLERVSAVVIIVLGLFFLATPFVARLGREWRIEALMARAGRGGPLVAGAAFAIAWTPCVGPTLGAILTAASLSHSTARRRLPAGLVLGGAWRSRSC